ncbi:MAG TPA: twin-arginine translocation signal domain-containing protein [Caldithrix abyssi]|uniref:nitrate reductase (cytochrome) n=1 Tax=Caldithrix abyssi TaxID=187145 RepID=A0A7V4UER1_CALAY|nr:twin-arginine translocation signal domain-containing protein [Caldithrix abyssi]
MTVSRREFLKTSAAATAAASIGVNLLPGMKNNLFAGQVEWHKSVCRYCGTGCGVMVGTKDGKVVAVKGDKENTINRGHLCVKAFYLPKAVNSKTRLKHAMIKKNGKFEKVTVDEALDFVAKKFNEIRQKHGANALAFYGSGQAETEETYMANKLWKGCIGTNNMEGNPRLCMASAVGGYLTSLGADEPAGTYQDIEQAKFFMLIGSNTAEAHPILFERIMRHKTKNPDVQILIIDPRKTPTDQVADLHLFPKPGYDLAILHAMAKIIIDEGYADEEFIKTSVIFKDNKNKIDYAGYKEFLKKYTPEYASQRSGVPAEDIIKAARMFGKAETAMSLWTMGINQRTRGVWANNLITNLHLLTGKIGKPGCDSFSLTGQPNACGGVREGGGLCHLLPGHRLVVKEKHRQQVAKVWGVPVERIQPKPGKHTVAMFEALNKGEIKGIYIMCTNPAQSLPNASKYWKGLEEQFVVVAESFFPTATTKYADVVLPSAFWTEKEGVYGCTERRSQYMPKVKDPEGDAVWDAFLLRDLGKKMGFVKEFEKYQTAQDIWDEYRGLTKGQDMDLWGATYDRLKKVRGLTWPVPSEDHPGTYKRYTDGDPIYDALPAEKKKGRRMYFYGPKAKDGYATIWARPDKGPEEPTDAEYPLALSTGRVMEHWHTGTMTMTAPELNRAVPKAYVEINPSDAKKMGINNKDQVVVETRRGSLEIEARVIDRPIPGTIFIPWHWEKWMANILTIDAFDPGSKEPEYKVCAARIKKA